MTRRASAAWFCAAYGLFVVYGSLVPLDYRPYPLERAWADFQHIPFLKLGVESRADWVANGVLYAPLAFLAVRSAMLAGLAGLPAVLLSIVACCGLAVGVEFTQLFFPPRTVSQNDILAECIGSLLGALVAPFTGPWLDRLATAWLRGSSRRWLHLLSAYGLGYLALCFFPYDLLLSVAELEGKVGSSNWGWWLAPTQRSAFVADLQLVVETALALPLGAWLALRRPGAREGWLAAGLLGALFGLAIEVGQFFIDSGVSQGASVLTRAVGVGAGYWLAPRLADSGIAGVRERLRRWVPLAWLAYLPLLCAADGLFAHPRRSAAAAAAVWADTRLLPFYYHYYTTEAIALFSLGSVVLMYLPVAVLGWVGRWRPAATVLAAAVLAVVMETAKLFTLDLHPDPTNVLIAAGAVAIALRLIAAAEQSRTAGETAPASAPRVGAAAPRRLSPWLLALPVVAVAAWTFPVAPVALLAGLALAALAVWRWPALALALLPAALPVFDLAPFSGRTFVDEFDFLALVCLAVALHRTPGAAAPRRWRPTSLAFLLLALSLAASTLRALWPLAPLDANSFVAYTSPYNALRIAKGAVTAALFLMLWRRLDGAGARRGRWFAIGMQLGLALTLLAVVWERLAFVGLWDFAADFRVSGPISAMHRGGAFIECWIAVAAAFALQAGLAARRWPGRIAAGLLVAGAAYAMMVTYSRNGYVAMAAAFAVVLAGALAGAGRRPGWRQAAWGLGLAGLAIAVALPILAGPYARQRLAASGSDLAVREAHWRDGLRLRDDSTLTTLVGMGLGRFPDAHYWRSEEPRRAATYRLGREGERHFLSLGQGATLYLQQIVHRPSAGPLHLALQLRALQGTAAVEVSLCDKWILSSLSCHAATARAPAGAAPSSWQAAEITLDLPAAREGTAGWRPPLTLTLATPAQGTVDVTDLRLRTASGEELLDNGNFAAGMDRWFFATDVDPPWQLHSLSLTVLFDQGWLGVLAWTAVVLVVLGRGTRLVWLGRARVPAALAAAVGFLVCGALNTLIDTPRFLCLLLLLLWLAAEDAGPGQRGGAGRPPP